MPNSYGLLLYHFIFSTKNWKPMIDNEVQQPLYAYIRSLLRAHGATVIEIGGMPDHIHIFVRLPRTLSTSRALCILKANSTRWLREAWPEKEFGWQDGYGAYTIGRTEVGMIRNYIRNQEEHHRNETAQEEMRRMLGENEEEGT